jgi:hypothetical protein
MFTDLYSSLCSLLVQYAIARRRHARLVRVLKSAAIVFHVAAQRVTCLGGVGEYIKDFSWNTSVSVG